MPHLMTSTNPARAGTVPSAPPLGIGVPGFAHPLLAPAEWAELLRLARGRARPAPGWRAALHWAVLDVAGGPGVRPDPHCVPAAAQLRDAGVRLLGHLDIRHGARPPGEVREEARRFVEWYGVDGFRLDRCPTERSLLPTIRTVTAALRDLREGAYVVYGHGAHPDPGYAETADQLVTFRGSWDAYRRAETADWTAGYPPDRFCHLVHDVPATHLDEVLGLARRRGAGTVYVTDRTERCGAPWESLPGYWDAFVSRIGPGVSE
ncbi:spherulation-specific family 4 protein [Streptomyces sp. NPDC003077]|uniref:spherulation-specific family 4 protein n=1 Tax=Streptomyces sp. NPDC003077 TaxID=3154443 RepID=UPI00339F1E96